MQLAHGLQIGALIKSGIFYRDGGDGIHRGEEVDILIGIGVVFILRGEHHQADEGVLVLEGGDAFHTQLL